MGQGQKSFRLTVFIIQTLISRPMFTEKSLLPFLAKDEKF